MTSLPCFKCEKPLEDAFPPTVMDIYNQAWGAAKFTSHGNYGSTVYDPTGSSREFLEVNLCDECLRAAADKGLILLVENVFQPPEYEVKPWVCPTGEEDEDET